MLLWFQMGKCRTQPVYCYLEFLNKSFLQWMPELIVGGRSTGVQLMIRCCQAKSHYLNQCCPRYPTKYVVTKRLWVNVWPLIPVPLKIQLNTCYFWTYIVATCRSTLQYVEAIYLCYNVTIRCQLKSVLWIDKVTRNCRKWCECLNRHIILLLEFTFDRQVCF